MRIAVFGNISPDRNPQFEKYIFSVCEAIKKYPIDLYLPDKLFYSFSPDIQDKIRPLCILFDVIPPLDMAMSVGGDGTFCVRLRQLVTEEYLFWESIRGDWDFSPVSTTMNWMIFYRKSWRKNTESKNVLYWKSTQKKILILSIMSVL